MCGVILSISRFYTSSWQHARLSNPHLGHGFGWSHSSRRPAARRGGRGTRADGSAAAACRALAQHYLLAPSSQRSAPPPACRPSTTGALASSAGSLRPAPQRRLPSTASMRCLSPPGSLSLADEQQAELPGDAAQLPRAASSARSPSYRQASSPHEVSRSPACPILLGASAPRVGSSEPSSWEDATVQRCWVRLLRLGQRERGVASPDDGDPVCKMTWGCFCKLYITQTGETSRCTCPKEGLNP
jgi:hypothetical protein